MSIAFRCENADCKQEIEVDDEMAGRRVRYPFCDATNDVPARPAETHYTREDERDYRPPSRSFQDDVERFDDEEDEQAMRRRGTASGLHTLATVLGVLAIIFGVLALLGGLFGSLAGQILGSVIEVPERIKQILLIEACLSFVSGALMLISGIQLVRKQGVGASALVVGATAVSALVGTMAGLVFGITSGAEVIGVVFGVGIQGALLVCALFIIFRLPTDRPIRYRGKTVGIRPSGAWFLAAAVIALVLSGARTGLVVTSGKDLKEWAEKIQENAGKPRKR